MSQSVDHDIAYDVPYSTMSTNLINGGNAINTIPAYCEFYFDLRNLPHLSPDEIIKPLNKLIENDVLPKMREKFPDAQIIITKQAAVPGLKDDNNQSLCKLIQEIVNDHNKRKVAYVTEAGIFQANQIPTIVCGPGSINEAHRADEYITLEQLELCQLMLNQVIVKICQ